MALTKSLAHLLASAVLSGPASALCLIQNRDHSLSVRQTTPETSNEFLDGGCRDVILFFARGTGAPGNMVRAYYSPSSHHSKLKHILTTSSPLQGLQPGRQLSDSLKSALGDSAVATQGVDYSAATLGNLAPGGSYPNDTAVYVDLINQAAIECPTSKIVLTGYSQGAALVVNALQNVSDAVKDQVASAVCFGDTQQFQDGGVIPGFDTDKTALYCNTGDVICETGVLIVTDAHANYTNYVSDASAFIQSRL